MSDEESHSVRKGMWKITSGVFIMGHIINNLLRANAYKYRESHDRKEDLDFLFLRQKDPFGELFSEIYFQSSSEFTFL